MADDGDAEAGNIQWYALDVVRQKEYLAGHILHRMGCETFIPTETRWRKRNRYAKAKQEVAFAAIPGLIFVGFAGEPPWLRIMNVSVVTGVLSIDDKPMPLRTQSKEWQEYRKSQLDGHLVVERVKVPFRGAEVHRSQVSIHIEGRGVLRAPKARRHMKSKREFNVGEDALVTDGPFRYNVVRVKQIVGAKAKVLLPLFGGVQTTVPLGSLEAA